MSYTNQKKTQNILFVVLVGVMAAFCFAATYINIKLPAIVSGTAPLLHLGNAVCLLVALLFGGLVGGLSGGIGMSFFDLINGYAYISWYTFIVKFLTGFFAGKIAYGRGRRADKVGYNILAVFAGIILNIILYPLFEIFNLTVLQRMSLSAAIIAVIPAAVGELVLGAVTFVIVIILYYILKKPIENLRISQKLER